MYSLLKKQIIFNKNVGSSVEKIAQKGLLRKNKHHINMYNCKITFTSLFVNGEVVNHYNDTSFEIC